MLCFRSCTPTCTWNRFMTFPFRVEGSGSRGAGLAATAVFREVADQPVHVLEISRIDDEAPVLPAFDQAGAGQMGEVKGKRGTGQIELFPYGARREALGTGLYEQTIDGKAGA